MSDKNQAIDDLTKLHPDDSEDNASQAVLTEKYQNLQAKHKSSERDWRVRDLFKQYIIGFLTLAFSVDKIPPLACFIMLIAVIAYLQFLATHYKVNYVRDAARQWHGLLHIFARKKLNTETKTEETEPLLPEKTKAD
ncbi:MAG: hypothetical protein DU429_05525 [Candidatus Tokpelaia sp.]|uniref:hypothetical protein n=1 Tax=Candidatus Tokpelaia sp. TaxID=2233777 RepID=UPI00123C406D|nr:hypothetical protein [Candidatus Tokpelaia sp.]KAA6205362.1 MAG: hypothetical protein DU430_04750 [Candidatus Tokpelaia sp.]KAA6206794.1 MAG: hypothetical protein DU429_05525 [Candidatus Tokpelaia sp.]KAA6406219.1 hypothetical protein DPQ22_00745 [Candidatus Tokpelaia sp.]